MSDRASGPVPTVQTVGCHRDRFRAVTACPTDPRRRGSSHRHPRDRPAQTQKARKGGESRTRAEHGHRAAKGDPWGNKTCGFRRVLRVHSCPLASAYASQSDWHFPPSDVSANKSHLDGRGLGRRRESSPRFISPWSPENPPTDGKHGIRAISLRRKVQRFATKFARMMVAANTASSRNTPLFLPHSRWRSQVTAGREGGLFCARIEPQGFRSGTSASGNATTCDDPVDEP